MSDVQAVEFYRDENGRSDAAVAVAGLPDRDAARVWKAITMVESLGWGVAMNKGFIEKFRGADTVYELRVSGRPAFRLLFFEVQRSPGRLLVVTHCVQRSRLKQRRLAALARQVEERRARWLARRQE